jgi:hypothetical protein
MEVSAAIDGGVFSSDCAKSGDVFQSVVRAAVAPRKVRRFIWIGF